MTWWQQYWNPGGIRNPLLAVSGGEVVQQALDYRLCSGSPQLLFFWIVERLL